MGDKVNIYKVNVDDNTELAQEHGGQINSYHFGLQERITFGNGGWIEVQRGVN